MIASSPGPLDGEIISLKHVVRKFQTDTVETSALSGVSLAIRSGEFLAITGPSGCGKSTLLQVLGLLDKPDAGEVRFFGEQLNYRSTTEITRRRRGRVGFVFQSFNLIDDLSVVENVAVPLQHLGIARKARLERALEQLNAVGLASRARHKPTQLSGGQQQRAAIARALATGAPLILADEPTGNLDSDNTRQVLDLLEALPDQGRTLVVVTHDAEIAGLAQRVAPMRDGRLVEAAER